MKMISSTSSTSINGVTLISELSPSPPPEDPIAMGQPSFFFVSICFCSVMAPTTRTPALRAISMACCTRPNSMFWSAFRKRILSLVRLWLIASRRPGSWSSGICLGPGPRSSQNLPSLSIPSLPSSCPSGRFSGFADRGMVAWKPAAISGVTIMKMMSNTSITSMSGVTLMSALTAARALVADRATGLRRLLRLEFLGEDRPAELRPDALDQVIDKLLRGVGHLDGEEVDLGGEVVVEPHGGNRDDQTEGGGDQRFGDTGRHRGERTAAARRRHAGEGVHDPHHRAQQSHERGRGAGGGEDAQAALELGRHDENLALHRALHRVDVGCGDGGAIAQQRLHLGEGLAHHAGHVAAVLLLGELDRAVELLFLEETRELGCEFPRLPLRPYDLHQFLDRV